jgi:hypothetical protein
MKNLFTLAFALLFTFSLTAQRGFLGIHSNHVSEEKAEALGFDKSSGSYVTNILDHSAAQKAGMQPFDYIYGLNDEETSDENDLTDLLGKYKPGEKVNVKMYRGGEKMSMAVVLGKESDGKSRKRTDKEDPFFGVSPIHEQLPKGVNGQPVAIVPNSTADEMGLQRGDILQAINGNPVLDWHDVGTAIDALQVGESIDVVYYRGKKQMEGSLPIRSSWATHNPEEALQEEEEEVEDGMEPLARLNQSPVIDILDMEVDMEPVTEEEAEEMKEEYGVDMPVINNLRIEQLNIFPNPNTGRFNLTFELPQRGNTSIRVFNSSARLLYSRDLIDFEGDFQDEIDITQNGPGIYFIMVQQGETSITRKVIVSQV